MITSELVLGDRSEFAERIRLFLKFRRLLEAPYLAGSPFHIHSNVIRELFDSAYKRHSISYGQQFNWFGAASYRIIRSNQIKESVRLIVMRLVTQQINVSRLAANSSFRSLPNKILVPCKSILIKLQTLPGTPSKLVEGC
jgi:hypothetical protein